MNASMSGLPKKISALKIFALRCFVKASSGNRDCTRTDIRRMGKNGVSGIWQIPRKSKQCALVSTDSEPKPNLYPKRKSNLSSKHIGICCKASLRLNMRTLTIRKTRNRILTFPSKRVCQATISQDFENLNCGLAFGGTAKGNVSDVNKRFARTRYGRRRGRETASRFGGKDCDGKTRSIRPPL